MQVFFLAGLAFFFTMNALSNNAHTSQAIIDEKAPTALRAPTDLVPTREVPFLAEIMGATNPFNGEGIQQYYHPANVLSTGTIANPTTRIWKPWVWGS
jgi:hypothetical protein